MINSEAGVSGFMTLSEAQIKVLGSEILYELGETFNEILERQLKDSQGSDWFEKSFKTKSKDRKAALSRTGRKDPYTLLHQITTEGNNIFRSALGREFKIVDIHYLNSQLTRIVTARNKWSHPDGVFTEEDLVKLITPIFNVLGNRNYALGNRCEEILISIREKKLSSFTQFSIAFGPDFKKVERANYLLREELMRFHDNSIEQYLSKSSGSVDLDGLDKSELIEINESAENYIVSMERNWLSSLHNKADQIVSEKICRWLLEFALLHRIIDQDMIRDMVELSDSSKVDGAGVTVLQLEQIRDLIHACLRELLSIGNELEVLRSKLGAENCACYWCELCAKYKLEPGNPAGDFLTKAIGEYSLGGTSETTARLIGEIIKSFLAENDLDFEYFNWIFALTGENRIEDTD
jgi:Swt1-like HEPN